MSDLQRRTVGAFIFLVPLAAAAVIFRIPIARAWSSRAFSEEVLHGYEQLYTGEKAGPEDSDNLPLRTGKVIILRPSTHFVAVTGGMTCVLFWTQITPEERGKITAKEDPPRIHDAWFEIDESLRPSTPDEVDTVIFCETAALKDGIYVPVKYPEAGPYFDAHRVDCVLKCYDRRSGRYLGAFVIAGEPPPEKTTVLGSHMGRPARVHEVVERMQLESQSSPRQAPRQAPPPSPRPAARPAARSAPKPAH